MAALTLLLALSLSACVSFGLDEEPTSEGPSHPYVTQELELKDFDPRLLAQLKRVWIDPPGSAEVEIVYRGWGNVQREPGMKVRLTLHGETEQDIQAYKVFLEKSIAGAPHDGRFEQGTLFLNLNPPGTNFCLVSEGEVQFLRKICVSKLVFSQPPAGLDLLVENRTLRRQSQRMPIAILLRRFKTQVFDDDRWELLRLFENSYAYRSSRDPHIERPYFTSSEILEVLSAFSVDGERVKALKFLLPYVGPLSQAQKSDIMRLMAKPTEDSRAMEALLTELSL